MGSFQATPPAPAATMHRIWRLKSACRCKPVELHRSSHPAVERVHVKAATSRAATPQGSCNTSNHNNNAAQKR